MKRRTANGFSLVEMMTVITIIVILASLIIGGSAFIREKQSQAKAKTQIGLLAKAIEEYHLDMGKYPGDEDTDLSGDVSEDLYQALFKEGYDYTSPATPPDSWTDATKIYLPELDPRTSKLGWVTPTTATEPPAALKIKDPWGNNYLYRTGKNAQNPDFDLWSMGKDGKTETADPDMKIEVNKDDIRNF